MRRGSGAADIALQGLQIEQQRGEWRSELVRRRVEEAIAQLPGARGLVAMERLMGMLLVMVAVQMLLSGVRTFLAR